MNLLENTSQIIELSKIRPLQMSKSTWILQNRVSLALCSHTSSCLIRFDNQEMTTVHMLPILLANMFLRGHVEIMIAEKLENLLGGFRDWSRKGLWVFIVLSKSHSVDSMPESVFTVWLEWVQRGNCLDGDFDCEGIFQKKTVHSVHQVYKYKANDVNLGVQFNINY